MKRFVCGDIVPGCDLELLAETEEEILSGVAGHAAKAHDVTNIPDSMLAQVRRRITDA